MSFKVFIQNKDDSSSILKKLNLADSLHDIRNNNNNTINDMLLFSIKSSNGFSKIERDDEKNFCLEEIVEKIENINPTCYNLYLMKNLRPSWNILNNNCKLDYDVL